MELGYEDFPEEGTRVRASLLPFDGDRYSRAQKLFRVGSITAACVGALAIVGLLSSPATKAAPEWVDATVSVSPYPKPKPNPNPNPKPDLNPNQVHFKNKFCPSCRAGIDVLASRIRPLSDPLQARDMVRA